MHRADGFHLGCEKQIEISHIGSPGLIAKIPEEPRFMSVTYRKKTETTEQSDKKRSGHTKVKPPLIPVTMPGRYSVGNVIAVSGWSHAKLSQRIRDKQFPEPMKDGHINYWPTYVVKEALGL